MPRYPHWLAPAGPGRFPPRVLCVDAVGHDDTPAADYPQRRCVLDHWAARTLLREKGDYYHHTQLGGHTTDQWWRAVVDGLRHGGDTLVLSQDCGYIWSLLGVWDAIDACLLRLTPDPDSARRGTDGARRAAARDRPDPLRPLSGDTLRRTERREYGYLVAGDRPCICVGRVPTYPGRLVWVDVVNYGTACPEGTAPGDATALCLAQWLTRYCHTLATLSLGGLCHTAGSQALRGFRCGYYAGRIYCHTHTAALGLEGDGYYGGRCECYRLGTVPETSYHLDYRSLYPYVMMHHQVPTSIRYHHADPEAAGLAVLEHADQCLARITVETDRPLYPYRRDGDIIYPVGIFTTVLPGPELSLAVDRGHLRAVHCCNHYVMGYPLADYARTLYALREECEKAGDPMMAAAAKALLVGLPGKLGQKERRWVGDPYVIPDWPWGQWYGRDAAGRPCRYRCLGLNVQREEVGGWAPNAVPALAAWITSWGRVRLLEAIEAAGWDQVYYCDTDCIVTGCRGYVGTAAGGLCHPTEIGKLRLKHGPCRTEVRGIKYYLVDDKVVCAGSPRGTARDAGDGQHYWYRQGVDEALRQGKPPEPLEELRSYARQVEYRHGTVGSDGRVSPIHVEE